MIDWNEVEQESKKLDPFKTFGTRRNTKDLDEIRKRSDQGSRNWLVAQKLLDHTPWSKISASEDALLKLIYILFLTEGPLSFYINAYSCGLILEGHHDVWLEDKQRFVSSFKEIVRVPLSTKLKFLERHGFKFFSEVCPKKVRNAIAHWDFNIEPDGTIYIGHQKFTKENSAKIIHEIVELLGIIHPSSAQT